MEWSNESRVGVKMSEPPMREIECFLVLAEELHFGRTGERLFISQSRVSQLISALERRIGTSLVARTSRRVHLTEFGADFLASLAPAHRALVGVIEDAQSRARNTPTPFRGGFPRSNLRFDRGCCLSFRDTTSANMRDHQRITPG